MFTCDSGHQSGSDDYCDTCGRPIGSSAGQAGTPVPDNGAGSPSAGQQNTRYFGAADGEWVQAGQQCDNCGADLDDRFCESCGHDSAFPAQASATAGQQQIGQPPGDGPGPARPPSEPGHGPPESEPPVRGPAADTWFAVASADREWYEIVRGRNGPDVESVDFPEHCPQRRFVLEGDRVTIGRRSRSRGTEPDIDLSGPPMDPGVSAQHATLLRRDDGGWEVVDLESTNGTTVGEALEPITPGIAMPLVEGDRIRLGAWTTLLVTSSPGE